MYQKLYNITKIIYDLYMKLLKEEKLNGIKSKNYLNTIEQIKISKYLEDRYYNQLSKYNMDDINSLARSFNTDDSVDHRASDFEFALELYEEDAVIKRRIFSKLVNLMISMEDEEYYHYFIDTEILELENDRFILNGKNITIGDRARRICEMLWNAQDNLYLSYLNSVQNNIDNNHYKNKYLRHKYIAIFISDNVENKLIEKKFELFDTNIPYHFENSLDIDIYYELMDLNIVNDLNQIIAEMPYIDNAFVINAAKTYIEANSFYLEPSLKEEFAFELENCYSTKKYAKLIK